MVEEDDDLNAPDQSMPDTCPPGDVSFGHVASTESVPVSGNHAARDGTEGIEGLDPAFLEAMPEDIRREIISNHVAQQSARTSQAPQTRSRGRPKGSSSGPKPVSVEAPQPKKRGRKKKEQKDDEMVPMAEEAGEQPGPATITTTPTTAKRKRGRPKKGDAIQPPPASELEDSASVMEITDVVPHVSGGPDTAKVLRAEDTTQEVAAVPKASSKRGRKKKVVEKPTAPVLDEPDETALEAEAAPEQHGGNSDEAEEAEEEEREPLRDISNTASQSTPATSKLSKKDDMQQEVTPEPKVKDVPRSASTTGQGGKVAFRVGLSKKSRIAPLLKMIRK